MMEGPRHQHLHQEWQEPLEERGRAERRYPAGHSRPQFSPRALRALSGSMPSATSGGRAFLFFFFLPFFLVCSPVVLGRGCLYSLRLGAVGGKVPALVHVTSRSVVLLLKIAGFCIRSLAADSHVVTLHVLSHLK